MISGGYMKNKLYWLEGIRGLVAFIVLFGHFLCAYYPALFTGITTDSKFGSLIDVRLASTPINIFWNGYFAVSIFFVLSGFVLTTKFFSTTNNNIIISSSIRRYVRLAIPITGSSLIAYWLLKTNLYFNDELVEYTGAYWYLPNYYNFDPSFIDMLKKSFIYTFLKGSDTLSYNAVLWTMKLEFFGSLLVFSMALLIGQLKNRLLFILFFLSSLKTLITFHLFLV